jgi:hypothetical protein
MNLVYSAPQVSQSSDCTTKIDMSEDNKNLKSIQENNPIFLFGHQRSGTNYAFSILQTISGTISFNEDNIEAFKNYHLREISVINSLIDKNKGKVVLLKPISDTMRLLDMRESFPNCGIIFLYRRPQEVIDSAAYEFSGDIQIVNHVINYDFFSNRLKETTKRVWDLPKLDIILDKFSKRFSSIGDYADKIALLWLVIHQFLLESGSLQGDNLMLISYEELTRFPLTFRNSVEKEYFCDQRTTKRAPPKVTTRRLFLPSVFRLTCLICATRYTLTWRNCGYRKVQMQRGRPVHAGCSALFDQGPVPDTSIWSLCRLALALPR